MKAAYQTVVEGSRQVLQVKPNVEGRLGWDGNLEAKTLKSLENVVTLVLEVLLQCDLLGMSVVWFQQGDRRQLQTK